MTPAPTSVKDFHGGWKSIKDPATDQWMSCLNDENLIYLKQTLNQCEASR